MLTAFVMQHKYHAIVIEDYWELLGFNQQINLTQSKNVSESFTVHKQTARH